MENSIRLFIVDDHQIVIDGLRAMLMTVSDIKVVGTAKNKTQLEEQLRHKEIDVLLLDINMPTANGIDIAKELLKSAVPVYIIMLTANTNKSAIMSSVKAGVHGFMPKECDKEELLKAIRRVAAGEHYFGTEIAAVVYNCFAELAMGKERTGNSDKLTEREIEVLRCFANGMSYKEVAEALFISTGTVETHKKSIFKKMNFDNHADLIKYAIREGIIVL